MNADGMNGSAGTEKMVAARTVTTSAEQEARQV